MPRKITIVNHLEFVPAVTELEIAEARRLAEQVLYHEGYTDEKGELISRVNKTKADKKEEAR